MDIETKDIGPEINTTARILCAADHEKQVMTITCFCEREVRFELERTRDDVWKDMIVVCECGQVYEVRG